MNKLAIYGGPKVRKTSFPSRMIGASLVGEEELKELADVVAEKSPFRHYGVGNPHKVKDFEEEAKRMLGSKYVLAVSSGSAALFCAVAALGIDAGDEVIMPAFGWYSVYSSVVYAGALPVFAEIDDTLNLDPEDFKKKITDKTKAVIVIHYQGGAAKIDEIASIAKSNNIKIIEDCAQAFGGQYKGKMLGTLGDIGITSFQTNKIITCGEGGLLYTDCEEYFARAVRYHDLGFMRKYFMEQLENKTWAEDSKSFAGLQFRMSELQGAFILAQIRKLPYIITKCRENHQKIKEYFKNSKHFTFRPVDKGECGITLFMKFATANEASLFSKALVAEGIPVGPSSSCTNLLDSPIIKLKKKAQENMPPFGKGCIGEDIVYDSAILCPKTNEILSRYVAIPISPLYSDEDIEDIIKAIEKVEQGLYCNH
ncbi:MAG: DegT/DnrJ/EryC1/StrS family aminotransferase [Candidatus Bathyarchaeia archaeon]